MTRSLILSLLFLLGLTHTCQSQDKVKKFRGVCFSSVRDNENPARQIHALPSAIEEDVALASKLANAIRTYTVNGSSYLIPEFCKKHGVDCIVGAWIGPTRWQNDAQLELLTHLAGGDNSRIKAVIIGNEVLHRGDCTESQLIDYVRRAKRSIAAPVAVADTWRAWIEHPNVASEVDICGVQIYPYWEGLSIDVAAQYTLRRVRDVQLQYPNKRVILTEFGWPTAGDSLGQAEANPENAARYIREVIPLLEQNAIEYYYFAVWNEKWKIGPEGGVGAHWGLFLSDGSVKPELKDLLPFEVRAGSKRPAREMLFQLAVDEVRNAPLTKVAFETPGSEPRDHGFAQRGVGLEASLDPAGESPYAGLRPLKQAENKEKKDQDDNGNKNNGKKTPPRDDSSAKETGETRNGDIALPDEATQRSDQATQSASGAEPTAKSPPDRALGPHGLHGICLSLFRDHETPHAGITPLLSELRADVFYSAELARVVRTYSATDSFSLVPELCNQIGLDCFPGAALGKYPWLNELELEMLIRIGQSGNPRVKALIVGNEVLHRGDFSVEQYLQYVRRVKQNVKVPVATAELLHSWLEHPQLAAEVDILGVQIYPYWGGVSIEMAAASTLQSVQELQNKYPGKRIILTEFGWPTAGGTIGSAAASAENAARYVREVVPLLNQKKIEYMYFAMSDEKWKQRDEGGPGPHWGLLLSDGQVKPSFESLLPPPAAAGMRRPPRKLTFAD